MTRTVEDTLRMEGGRVLATLIRLTGDFDLAEDALQDAVVEALQRWGPDGVPSTPAAWLTTVARNKALDRLRRESVRGHKEADAIRLLSDPPPVSPIDDRLRLIFTCCHPALSPESRVALTLRTVGGLTTTELARCFFVSDATMGQRLSRAKAKIARAKIPYRVPDDHELPDRLSAVLATVYLVFTAGHHAPHGALDSRRELAEEAIRLGRLLLELLGDHPEVPGLLSLMLATHARRQARLDGNGDIVLLADQDRDLWDHHAIREASDMLQTALRRRLPGPYQIQAAIACLHGIAPSDAATDWKQIVDLYRMLENTTPLPVVAINRAVAEAKVFGPDAGLAVVNAVTGMEHWHLYWSTRAELLRQSGRNEEAAAAYRKALDCDMNQSDRRFLERRLGEIDTS
ncbi:MAG TPA: RNA polymerase sigma factor [Acidimicrobiia bacterium]|nr:RNA polymerase sigma factor [Acidimicrobiia bacterium]